MTTVIDVKEHVYSRYEYVYTYIHIYIYIDDLSDMIHNIYGIYGVCYVLICIHIHTYVCTVHTYKDMTKGIHACDNYVHIHVYTYIWLVFHMFVLQDRYVFIDVCMHVCMYACMHACM